MVDLHYEGLWAYVAALTAGATEGEDIVHEAFLLAFDRLAAGQEFEGDAGKWLRGTARNLVYAWWRRRRRMPQDVADRLKLLADDADDVLSVMARKEVRAALEACLGKLPAADRQLLAQRYEQGRRITRIAERLRKSAVAVRLRLFRIRQGLKRCLEATLFRGGAS